MKTLLQLEEAAKWATSYYLTLEIGFPWWSFWVWMLAPDLSILAYAANPRIGAWVYNVCHHQGLALAMAIAGLMVQQPALQFAGLILLGHSAFDRVLGYGLKYNDDFRNTHLGWIGKKDLSSN
ncbi:MAG: DUF4260 domain-containing protein [Saprospiraceae bacterium]|nr:DUF4260 domain-containing protein [Saprospiraceae bacterium]